VALNKPAAMSSELYPASNAVDGVTKCGFGGFAHTYEESKPWLRIDLQDTFDISKVIVVNRRDGFGTVKVANDLNIIWGGGLTYLTNG
jgi:hypothetical protein